MHTVDSETDSLS